MVKKDNIFALATPNGKSAIALFRISGPRSHNIIKSISSNKKIKTNKVELNYILDKNKLPIDQTLTTYFNSPKSFTGENMVEISCHGGAAIINKITKKLLEKGMRVAEPGEFTRRAFENNKLDLIKVEALSDLINANTEKQRELALKNLRGELSGLVLEISKKIQKLLANVEAIIDFSDEDLPKGIEKEIKEQKKNIIDDIEKIINRSKNAKAIRSGFLVSVIGKPNTGKSSFVNFISGRDVSIVTKTPGTTTDLIESVLDIKGYQVTFIDTAGIRKYRNKIEKIGISKTIETTKKVDLNIIFLEKNEKELYKKIKNKIFVRSKFDIRKNKKSTKDVINISSRSGYGINKTLKKTITTIFPNNSRENPIISRERQLSKLQNCLETIKVVDFNKNIDMIAADIRQSLKQIEGMYYNLDIEQLLDLIFNDFCIGK
tara:strand:- start:3907 stop:5205 length:1299 start_codon:yes stop_codon:yes gene_type:complete